MRVLQGTPKVGTAPAIEFTANSVRDELAAVLFPTISVLYKSVRQGHHYPHEAGHFILPI
jgi:hypothetical protein